MEEAQHPGQATSPTPMMRIAAATGGPSGRALQAHHAGPRPPWPPRLRVAGTGAPRSLHFLCTLMTRYICTAVDFVPRLIVPLPVVSVLRYSRHQRGGPPQPRSWRSSTATAFGPLCSQR
jgi:hypothetical protein